LPQDFVTRKDAATPAATPEQPEEKKRPCGIIQSVNSDQRTATILWLPESKTSAQPTSLASPPPLTQPVGDTTAAPSTVTAASTTTTSDDGKGVDSSSSTPLTSTTVDTLASTSTVETTTPTPTSTSASTSSSTMTAAPLTSALVTPDSRHVTPPVITGTTLEENVSIYSLEPHPEHDFRVAGIVVAIPGNTRPFTHIFTQLSINQIFVVSTKNVFVHVRYEMKWTNVVI
jgi:hypothetical protein